MGRHRAPETDLDDQDRTVPVLRLPQVRPVPTPRPMPMPRVERQVPGLLFPIVDDLSMIAADDQMLDSIAAGRADFGDLFASAPALVSGDPFPSRSLAGALEPLLVTWRCEVIEAPLPPTPRLPAPVRPMQAPRDKPARRAIKPMIAAAAAISALLLGSTAVGARSAKPGDTLWPLAQVLYSGHADSVMAQLNADRSLSSAVVLLSKGDAPKALVALTSASSQVEQVELGHEREILQTRLDKLWVRAQNETQAAASSAAGVQARSTARPGPVQAAVVPGSTTGSTSVPTATSKPSPSGTTTRGTTTGPTTSGPSRPGGPTAPVVIVAPTTRPTSAGVTTSTAPVKPPVTTHVPPSSPPPVVVPTTQPVITPTPPTVPVTTPTPTTPAPVTSPPDTPTPTPTPTPSSEPVVSDVPTPTDLSTTSEIPTPSVADTPTDVPQANGAVPAQATDASQ